MKDYSDQTTQLFWFRHHLAKKKLTPRQVTEIREVYEKGNVTQKELAAKYKVSIGTINKILNGLSYWFVKEI